MGKVEIEINLRNNSQMHIGAGNGFSDIIDQQTLSYNENQKRWPIILGHTVKGIVREQYRQLLSICNFDNDTELELFGSVEKQGSLFFSPLNITKELKELLEGMNTLKLLFGVRSGNQINRIRKVAQQDRLFSHEVVKENIAWSGKIQGNISNEDVIIVDDQEYPLTLGILLLAVKSVKRIGSRKSVGMGECTFEIKSLWWNESEIKEDVLQKIIKNSVKELSER